MIDGKLKLLNPVRNVTKVVNWIIKNPKVSALFLVVLIVALQSLMLCVMDRGWIGDLFKFLKP